MNSVRYNPLRKRVTCLNGSRAHMIWLTLLISFVAFQKCQSFVPSALRTTQVPRAAEVITSSLKQQLIQIEPIKNNGVRGEIEIDKSVLNSKNNTGSVGTSQPRNDDGFPRHSTLKLSRARIESAVDDMLKSTRSMGLLGESMYSREEKPIESTPKGNTVLAGSVETSARVATSMDDIDIANLRLSVFANFNPESRRLFCDRSCQLLSSRRQRGATCIVATTNKSCNDELQEKKTERIVGTAETSFHEFSQTLLGYSRPKDSILYITEVAVDSNQRRKGIARLMMEAIETLAKIRKVETIYLHVDVTNSGAAELYEKAGYRKMDAGNPMYLEFTTKLNLHDGATKGRCHYLMAKDIRQPTWLNIREQQKRFQPRRRTLAIEVMPTF